MTGHADFGGGNPGKGGFFDGGVTVAAIDSEAAHMMLVTEGHRLLHGNIDARCEWRPIDGMKAPGQTGDEQEQKKNYEARNRIAAGSKYLRHKTRRPKPDSLPFHLMPHCARAYRESTPISWRLASF